MWHEIICVGRMVNTPELRHTPSGKTVTDFSLAIDAGWGDNKETVWMRVTVWGTQAETVCKYMEKGRQCLVEGTLKPDEGGNPRVWTGSDGSPRASYEMTASRVVFLGDKPQGGKSEEREESLEGEIPF